VVRVTLSTIEEWQEASDTLARMRAGRTPDKFPYALGIDHPDAMKDWLALDAADTLLNLLPTQAMVFVNQGMDESLAVKNAIASALATHAQMGLELGLWLAQTKRVVL
jgi:hypothetical protein